VAAADSAGGWVEVPLLLSSSSGPRETGERKLYGRHVSDRDALSMLRLIEDMSAHNKAMDMAQLRLVIVLRSGGEL
jgi:hypothetical protein